MTGLSGFPSFPRRGGRDIKNKDAKPHLTERTGWLNLRCSTTPSVPAEVASRHFIKRAAPPPWKGGESGHRNLSASPFSRGFLFQGGPCELSQYSHMTGSSKSSMTLPNRNSSMTVTYCCG